jgi:membrane protein DedA with SNARE-associated domain
MLETISALILHYRYLPIIPLAFIEGPFTTMLSGALFRAGNFQFLPLYLFLIIGDLLGDIFWYAIGRSFGHRFIARFGKYVSITERNVAAVKRVFARYHDAIFFISKITMGMGFALVTLFTAGTIKTPFRRFLLMNALGQIVWTGALMLIGYSLGNMYLAIGQNMDLLSIAGLIAIAFALLAGAGIYLKNEILRRYAQ